MSRQNHARRAILRAFGIALLLFVGLYAAVSAQQVSEGRNVMPVWMPCDPADPQCQNDPRWQDAWKFGDIFLQRQVECSLDSSALNSDHLLAACIDYSGIEIGNDTQIPVANNNWTRFTGFLAKLVGRPSRASLPRASAASEAWIRGMWSTNGFATSTPFFVPGAPWANSAEDQRTFYWGTANATSDPIVVSGLNGDIHVIYMAFHRLPDGTIESNYMVDWPLIDKNIPDEPGKHSLASKGPPVMIAGGSNGTFGGFRDKGHALVVPNAASPAGYDLYVSYTVFTGTGRLSASHIYVAKTTNGGSTWTAQKVSQSTNAVSGTVLTATLSGQVSVFYRGFGSSPTIYYSKQGSGGWSKPEPILGKTYPTLMTFDQVNVKVDSTSDAKVLASEGNITPRSNGFPTAAVAHDGTIFVAWQECAHPVTGLPLACASGGSPRIMLTFSTDGGSTFSQRKPADNGVRTPEPNGLGYFWYVGRDNDNAHPQIMPSLSCTVPTGGTSGCLLTYWESRTAPLTTGPDPFTGQPVLGIGGYHRLMDLRGALLNTSGTVARSFQISRFPYRPNTNLVDSSGNPRPENVNDIARVNEVINADGTSSCFGPPGVEPPLFGLDPGCIPRLNFHRNQSGGGVIYFAGDYHALVRSTSWVRQADGSSKVPTAPQEVPWVGWRAISTTNQNLIPPAELLPSTGGTIAGGNQLTSYTLWTPGTNGLPACTVGGSRNTDSYFHDITLGLLVTTPVTAKTTASPGDAPFITFPVQVWNNSTQAKTVRFTIDTPETGSAHSSFSKNATVKTGLGTINPNSSTVHVVYVTYAPAAAISPVRVSVAEVNPDGTPKPGGIVTGVTLNAAGTQQPSSGSVASSVTVSDPITGSIQAGSIQAVAAANITGSIQAGSIQAGSIQAGSIQAAWIVEAGGDPTAPRSAVTNVDASFWADYNFRTRIYQLSSIGACVDTNGNATVQYQARLVGNGSIQAGSIQAGSIQAIALANGFPNDPMVDNSLFVPKPGKKPSGTQSASTTSTTECRIGECVEAQPPETEFTVVQLVAEPKTSTPSVVWDPVTFPPAVTVASYWCDINVSDCQLTEVGPDLVVSPTPGVSAIPDPVNAGSAIQFPANGYSVQNNGNRRASARRYGFYLSKAVGDSVLHLLPNGQVDQTQDVLLGYDDSFVSPLLPFNDPTTPGTFDLVTQRSLTIPVNTTPGVHYLFLYADDLRKVSETHEENNVGKVAITVLPPNYQLIGLFTPCSGLTCGPRNSGSATPIAFQLSFDGVSAVDSGSTKPRLRFYDSGGALLFSADPDDVSSGGSLWQYYGASCAPVGATTCARPAYTWQYNWQTRNPVTGQNLPSGTYIVKVEVPATKQFDGAPDGEGAVATITVTVR